MKCILHFVYFFSHKSWTCNSWLSSDSAIGDHHHSGHSFGSIVPCVQVSKHMQNMHQLT